MFAKRKESVKLDYKPLTLEDAAEYQDKLKGLLTERFKNASSYGGYRGSSTELACATAARACTEAVQALVELDQYVHETLIPRAK